MCHGVSSLMSLQYVVAYKMTFGIQTVMTIAVRGRKIITKASQIPELFVTTGEWGG
jgi:hypothetical protein